VSTKAHSLSFISKVGYIDIDIPSILSLSSLDGCRLNSSKFPLLMSKRQTDFPPRLQRKKYFMLWHVSEMNRTRNAANAELARTKALINLKINHEP
jgi:hypothetical protein